MESTRRSLTVVIPAFNEALRLGVTLDAAFGYLQAEDLGWRIVVVDDGSADDTSGVAWRCAQASGVTDRVVCLRLDTNSGKGAAVRHGLRYALKSMANGDTVMFYDADGSFPINQTAALVAAIDGGADVAIGSRPDRTTASASALRRCLSVGARTVARVASGLHYTDTQCGFKAFNRAAAETIARHGRCDRFAFDIEMLMIANRLNLSVVEVPVSWHDVPGSTVRPIRDSLRFFRDLVCLRRDVARHVPGPAL